MQVWGPTSCDLTNDSGAENIFIVETQMVHEYIVCIFSSESDGRFEISDRLAS